MKSIRLTILLATVILAASSCKTKQKITEIPAGANIEAAAPKTSAVTTPAPSVSTYSTPKVEANEAEVTRNENFTYVDGEKDALKSKYHVVVGSFGKQTNAKGLQSTLVSEGNKALIVINEKGMYRVLISSFNDYSQAHVYIKQISNRFPDAWVLVQR